MYAKLGKEYSFSEATMEKVQKLISHYPEGRQKSALLPVLQIAQEEFGGTLNVDIMDYVASLLSIQPIEVYEVATFYTQFYLDTVGKYVIEICRTGPCAICGGDDIQAYIEEKLNIKEGETTADGLFTLKAVECLGACGYAPMMQLGDFYKEHLNKEKIDQLIADCKDDKIILHDK